MVTERLQPDEAYDLIAGIPDPEIPVITIKDLGILRGVRMEHERCIVTITPTYTACPAMKMIEDQVREILSGHGVKHVVVETIYNPAWTTDWLLPEAKQKLKSYGIAPPMHSSCVKLADGPGVVLCPRCNAKNTSSISRFGSTACKALYKCNECEETFDFFKCH